MTRLVLSLICLFVVRAFADTPGTMTVGFFDGNILSVELTGAVSEIAEIATSSKNIQCNENICRFDFDTNAKALRPRLNMEEAPIKDQTRISIESSSRGVRIVSYSANGDPNRGTLVKALYKILEENSKREKSKIKGELITNHDYAFDGINLRCTSFASGDYLCEMTVAKNGLVRN